MRLAARIGRPIDSWVILAAMAIDSAKAVTRSGQMTVAGRLQPGDEVFDSDRFVTVTRLRRAQGRKPPSGENLHVLVDGEAEPLRLNSLEPVRIRRSSSS